MQVDGKDQSSTKETMISKRRRTTQISQGNVSKQRELCVGHTEINRTAFSRLAELFRSLANQEG